MSYHRTQKVGTSLDPRWMLHCTIYAFLTAIAIATKGKYGPGVYGPEFREGLADQEGGIDLWDGYLAIRRVFPTVAVDVHANYGPTPTPRANLTILLAKLATKKPHVIQGSYAVVPQALSGQWSFKGPHAVTAVSYDVNAKTLVISDPLRPEFVVWPLALFVAFASALSGSTGYVLAAGVRPTFKRRARIAVGFYHRYAITAGVVTRTRHFTLGSTVDIGPDVKFTYDGVVRRGAKVLNGAYYLNLGAARITTVQEIR